MWKSENKGTIKTMKMKHPLKISAFRDIRRK